MKRYLVVWSYDHWEVFDTVTQISYIGSDYVFGSFLDQYDAHDWIKMQEEEDS